MQRIKNLFEITSQFKCHVDVGSLKSYGSGHINDTYYLSNLVKEDHNYLLQRINHQIFKNVPELMDNMYRVINHLKMKVLEESGNPDQEVLTLLVTKDGPYFYKDNNGDYWRMCYFLKNTRTYDLVETEKQAYEGGKAFGKFQARLSDLPAETMHEVIPDFHNIEKRLEQLAKAVETDATARVQQVRQELEIIQAYAASMSYFQEPAQAEILIKRVIHNNTKFNNVLLNRKNEAQYVIDLDTVMAGYVAYDFGDAIRTTINTTVEDEGDLSKIQLNLSLFDAYTQGYLEEAGQFLTASEVDSLLKGVLLLPYMQAVRFLTDYINGDKYFKINFEQHNLQRAKAQLQLLKMLDLNASRMQNTIAVLSSELSIKSSTGI
ncbi:aminoglycoside phosphotransferase family protein [Pedobacter sp. PAMC26386]|nr:aminoglycoside phosphotransferase family protein [Pedobacter sp. PAMC26386]